MSVEECKENGLPAIRLSHPSGATALVYQYGAHVASWKTSGGQRENIFISSAAEYGGGKAIRGGVPICWPQFNTKGPLGKHGFVRNSAEWTIVRTSTEPYPCVVLGLVNGATPVADFPFKYRLQFAVTLDGAESLSTSLTVANTGDDPFEFTTALHTYFACDVAKVKIQGLEDVAFESVLELDPSATQTGVSLLPIVGEVDRTYLGAPAELYIHNVADGKAMKILKQGFPDAVVWNIGKEKAPSMKDLGSGEWAKYVCVEAGLIGKPHKLAGGTSWVGGQTFTCMAEAEVPAPPKKKKEVCPCS